MTSNMTAALVAAAACAAAAVIAVVALLHPGPDTFYALVLALVLGGGGLWAAQEIAKVEDSDGGDW